MNRVGPLILKISDLLGRYRWAVAIFGFVSGVASFVLVDREQEKFPQLVSALVLLSWAWLVLENLVPRGIVFRFSVDLGPGLLRFASQMVHQESLFFTIPFFFLGTSWDSGQLVFTSLLLGLAIVSITDPVYYHWLAPRPWLFSAFNGLTLFAALLTTLPILFSLPTAKTYFLSLILAIILSLPVMIRAMPSGWWRRGLVTLILISVAGGTGVSVRAWIPPASLRLLDVAVTDNIIDSSRRPENALQQVSVEQLSKGLYAYTAVRAPRGLHERIYHVWILNGIEVDRIALNIDGGRESGFRAWSHKLNFPPYPSGKWKIYVVTEANQVLGVLRFDVVDFK